LLITAIVCVLGLIASVLVFSNLAQKINILT
jgi:hypothetical protein